MAKSDLRGWAAKGAEQRLVEIAAEAKSIFATFPELRGRRYEFTSSQVGGASARTNQGNGTNAPGRKKRTMSADARKRIGDAQRARWAKQKGLDSAQQAPSSPGSQGSTKGARKKR